MALLAKSDLQSQYSWTAIPGDNPRITGKPDSTLFNRHEGYEVLYLINAIGEEQGWKQKASGLKLEKMIKQNLPSDVRSQENVKKWLLNNWDKIS